MRKHFFKAAAIATLLFAGIATASAGGWIEGSQIGVRTDNSKNPNAIFVNTGTPAGPVENTWHRIKVADLGIPEDAKSVFLAGLLIITQGNTYQTCAIHITFRAPGDAMIAGNYIGQAVEANMGNGIRSNMATWTPVNDGEIEFYWYRTSYGPYPYECAYGINLSAQAYVR